MMTPKKEAIKLVDSFIKILVNSSSNNFYEGMVQINFDKIIAKQCALMVVDKILYAITMADYGLDYLNQRDYWEQVKQEIEKL